MANFALAADCTHYGKEATEIRTKVRPRLQEIRAERNLQKKIDRLLAEIDLVKAAIQTAPRDLDLDLSETDRLRRQLQSLSPLIGRMDLNAEQLQAVTISINTILDRLTWNSKMVESELQEHEKACTIMDAEGGAPLFEKLKFGWRGMIYSTRIGVLNAIPALYTAGAYNLAITRLEQITATKARRSSPRPDSVR